jgi:hypothetical protein
LQERVVAAAETAPARQKFVTPAERVTARRSAPPDLVVIQPLKDFTCAECGTESGDLLVMDDIGPLCMDCADMDHLVFVPSGDAALTRRARKASPLSAVVVRWSQSRKRSGP